MTFVRFVPVMSLLSLNSLSPHYPAGVRDDNGARDAVVKRFLKDADSIWIVSHIGRAVNDKTAKVGWDKTGDGGQGGSVLGSNLMSSGLCHWEGRE